MLLYLKLAWLKNKIISFKIAVYHNKIISTVQYDIMKSFNKSRDDCNCDRPRDTLIFFFKMQLSKMKIDCKAYKKKK